MKNKNIALFIGMLMTTTVVFGQNNPIEPGQAPNDTGNFARVDTDPDAGNFASPIVADEELTTVLIDSFEVPQGWQPSIPLDFGISKAMYKEGSPQELAGDNNRSVLGVKTIFFRRNYGWMSVDKPYPMSLKSVVRAFSIWISGRNTRHTFFIKVRDLVNNRMRLPGGEMRFQGWKKVNVPVSGAVVQTRPGSNTYGLDFLGFHINFIADDIITTEPYHMYFDYLTASMNLAPSQAADDISDDW